VGKPAEKELEKKISREAKDNPKAFDKYAQSKLKTRARIVDLKAPDGTLLTAPKEKADILNNFLKKLNTLRQNLQVLMFFTPEFYVNYENILRNLCTIYFGSHSTLVTSPMTGRWESYPLYSRKETNKCLQIIG